MFRWLAALQAPFLSVTLPQPSLAVVDRPHSLAFPSYSNVIREALPACDQGYKMANSSGAKCWVDAHRRGISCSTAGSRLTEPQTHVLPTVRHPECAGALFIYQKQTTRSISVCSVEVSLLVANVCVKSRYGAHNDMAYSYQRCNIHSATVVRQYPHC